MITIKYTDVILPEYIDKYVEMQKALFLDFNRIVFDIVFLQKALANKELNLLYDSMLVIEKLFGNEFQYLIIKISRCLFDTGTDVITLPRFKNRIIRDFIKPEYKQDVCDIVKNSRWNSDEIKDTISRVKISISGFRNHYLAHNLEGQTEELTIPLDDIEAVFNAATELFSLLSFETGDIYSPVPTDGRTFSDEKQALSEFCDRFFDYQYLSSPHVQNISYRLDNLFVEERERTTIEQHVSAINIRKS